VFLAVARLPADSTAPSRAATALAVALPDFVRRLTGPLPRVLLTAADPVVVERGAEALRALGYGVVTVDPAEVPGDTDRLVPRTLRFDPEALIAIDTLGLEHPCPWAAIGLVQRALRPRVEVETTTTSRKELSLSRSVMSGGLVNRRTVTETKTNRTEAREALVVVHRTDGGRDVALYEKRLDFRFLGAEMQVVGFANLERTVAWLRARVPHLRVEDRVGRPGFLAGMPTGSVDPVDLGLEIVRRAVDAGVLPPLAGA
jgi:hypothetical protein